MNNEKFANALSVVLTFIFTVLGASMEWATNQFNAESSLKLMALAAIVYVANMAVITVLCAAAFPFIVAFFLLAAAYEVCCGTGRMGYVSIRESSRYGDK
jgi:hypothetical protein